MDSLISTKLAPPATVGPTVARGYAMDRLLQARETAVERDEVLE